MDTLPIAIRFNYEKQDFSKAWKYHPEYRRARIRDSLLSILSIGFGVFVWLAIEKSWLPIYLILIGIILFSLRFILGKIMTRRLWSLPKNRSEIFLEFSDEGIIYKTEGIDSKLQWTIYDNFIETPDAFLLLHSKSLFTIIPKRTLEQPEQLAQFKGLLKKHAPQKNKKPK